MILSLHDCRDYGQVILHHLGNGGEIIGKEGNTNIKNRLTSALLKEDFPDIRI